MIPDFSVKTSREIISINSSEKYYWQASSGFTLLELVISMTIVSMVVVVLYFAFSTGSRVWDRDLEQEDEQSRLEAVLRLINNDMSRMVPYDMNHEGKVLSLPAGGSSSFFYVTGNGTGSMAGTGAGLYFSVLFVDECEGDTEQCLYLYKSPRPEEKLVDEAKKFRNAGERQRELFGPGTEIAENSILLVPGVEDFLISYSSEEFKAFTGTEPKDDERSFLKEGSLDGQEWIEQGLPGQVRVSFTLKDQKLMVHSPVYKASGSKTGSNE